MLRGDRLQSGIPDEFNVKPPRLFVVLDGNPFVFAMDPVEIIGPNANRREPIGVIE